MKILLPVMHNLFSKWATFFFAARISALGDTDTVTWGGDNTRCGYQTNHNMDPNVVGSSDFGQIFKTLLPGNFNGMAAEQIFASPLVYTGNDGVQHVYVSTTQNNLYKLNAKTGAIVMSRNLHVPFLQVELESCVDINPLIGITATGVIDPVTGIWYVTSKTYTEQFQNGNFSPTNPPGRLNGRYWQHAVHTEDLSEAAGWPVLIDGTVFRNNPNRMFIGGNQHSRPGALLVGDYLYTGYASHCVQYNYTGAIIGVHKTTGQIIEAYAMEGGPEPNSIRGGGVWMSGGGLAYDGRGSMYFATGNGYASQLKATGNAVPGRTPPTSLEEAAINAKIHADGTLSIIDFFMPWEKTQLDGADKDLGSSPLEILPSDVFSCPNQRRIGVVTGKSGKTYWLDLDNLGGYQMGANSLDAAIQVFQNENSVYVGAGVLPLGGGYVYISVTRYPTHVFKFSCNSAGNAIFTKISDTPDSNAYIVGTGHGTTTSLAGQEGTGLLWTTDVEGQGLRIYNAIPPSNGGNLTKINGFNIPGIAKFSRPAFGDGRVYLGTTRGYIYGFGSPVNSPLNCSSPYSFGPVTLGNVSNPLVVTCKALINTRVDVISLQENANFVLSNIPTLPLTLTSGQTFTFNASCSPLYVGSLSADAAINVTNMTPGFSSRVPVALLGTGYSSKPLLAIAPNTISFAVIAGQPSSVQSSLFLNLGNSELTFTNITFSLVSESGPWIDANLTSDGNWQVGKFVFVDLPRSIGAGKSAPISVIYTPDVPGNDAVYVKGNSDGGWALLDVFGVAGTQPKSVIEFQTTDGSGWVEYVANKPFDFGTVLQPQTRNLLMRITNGGGRNAVPLSITVSKPPYGVPGIIGKSNNIDLAEGISLTAGKSETANLYCNAPASQVNLPNYNGSTVWVLNTGDPVQGKQTIQFSCTAATEQVGPLFINGTAQYGYVGCFKENNPGRQLATQAYADKTNNTIGRCTTTCFGLGYVFAGTQYSQECWCGNAIPIQKDDDKNCNLLCTGNSNQTCGGDGYFHDTAHISLFADSTKFNGNTASPPLQLTQSVGNYVFVGCYTEKSSKTLSDKSTVLNTMTVEICQAFCSMTTPPFQYFGLEYAAECYCGQALNSASTVLDATACNMPCKGSNSEYCGAGGVMQIYGLASTSSVQSTVSSTVKSAVSSTVSTEVTKIMSSALSSDVTTIPLNTDTSASTRTRTNIYTSTTSGLPTTSSAISSSSTTMASSTSSQSLTSSAISMTQSSTAASQSGPTPTPSVGSYTYMGCWTDPINLGYPHVLNTLPVLTNVTSMTPSLCASYCTDFATFGLEYSSECYCGPHPSVNSKKTNESDCNSPCTGDTKSICGAGYRLSLYTSLDPAKISTDPSPPALTLGNYTYANCMVDEPSTRLLPTVFVSADMTNELCIAAAEVGGFKYAGTEYANECWMGNVLSVSGIVIQESNGQVDESQCGMMCAGAKKQPCGGPNRMTFWKRIAGV
ncbi:WSC-domain-containing protein [Pleomassaria siparia CBS 279.74]|uniref:WSC-domain-containing protein n=1 Tax=Pleomassaria siparia CBS 279.74 TaxID=1314801 RepID=A0A6G1KFT8_9PLEO|nr:WSC-domain-containing protein [Pleomassaria siparia CBS 279.74]